MIWQTTRFRLDLSTPKIMGIVNVTPDSFADDRPTLDASAAATRCQQLVDEGADLLDIGGESTRPGALPVPLQMELDRLLPVLEAALKLGVPVSVDTRHAAVMREALRLGVDIVNDIQALQGAGALDAVVENGRCGVCLMHMQGDPEAMQRNPEYGDVVAEVGTFLMGRGAAVEGAGVARERIVFDPGIGFGKTPAHNLELLRRQPELIAAVGGPLLVGWSRKATLGKLTGRPVDERLVASVVAALLAVERGARVVRVHDVAATVDALKVWRAVQSQN